MRASARAASALLQARGGAIPSPRASQRARIATMRTRLSEARYERLLGSGRLGTGGRCDLRAPLARRREERASLRGRRLAGGGACRGRTLRQQGAFSTGKRSAPQHPHAWAGWVRRTLAHTAGVCAVPRRARAPPPRKTSVCASDRTASSSTAQRRGCCGSPYLCPAAAGRERGSSAHFWRAREIVHSAHELAFSSWATASLPCRWGDGVPCARAAARSRPCTSPPG